MREAATTEAATTGAAATDAAGLPATGDERSSAAAETPRRRPAILWSALGRFARVVAPPLAFGALLLIAWDLWVRARDVKEYLVPAPAAVAAAFADDPMRFIDAARLSLAAALGGLLIASLAAFALAVLMAHSRPAERAVYPWALMLKVTPIVAVYPLFTIWFGFSIWPKMLIAALITFFPMLVNAVIGLRSVDAQALDFMRALDASRAQVFWKLRLPASLPYVFAALRISVPLSLIGAVVAEFLSGASGMGQLILIANGDFDTPTLFAAVFVLALMGVFLTAAVSIVERRVLFWHESAREV